MFNQENLNLNQNKQNIFEHEIQFDKQSSSQPININAENIKSENNSKNIGFNFENSNSQENPFLENNSKNFTQGNSNSFVKEYISDVNLYGLSIQNNQNTLRLAVSSLETSTTLNKIEIVEFSKITEKLTKVGMESTLFPQSKINWCPNGNNFNLLAATSDNLRVYKYNENNTKLSLTLEMNKQKKNCGPLTSMDWNRVNPNLIGVCSVDTTCTIWDLTKQDIKTHLIAHDKEVFDINFGPNENTFISTGADGSIRLFDLRALDTCSVIFESLDQTPINRIKWNLLDDHYIAATVQDKNIVYIIDSRVMNSPYACLTYHSNLVNEISWAPNSWSHICTVGDDKNSLIWDISMIENKSEEPIACYKSENEIENCQWSEPHEEWIAINSNNVLKLLKVI